MLLVSALTTWVRETIDGDEMSQALRAIGLLTVSVLGWKVVKATWHLLKLYAVAQLMPQDLRKLGKWAVVTGCTDGLGYYIAHSLARRGLNLVLISRTDSKLRDVSNEISNLTGVLIKTIAADLSTIDCYDNIQTHLRDLDIGVLVNNVGMTQPKLSKFADTENFEELAPAMLNTNCLSMMHMTWLVLPRMLEQRRGTIVNVSSQITEFGYITSTPYTATKSFASCFSDLIRRTYCGSGVHIQTLTPGLIQTRMLGNFLVENPSKKDRVLARLICVDPQALAESALNTVGYTSSCHGHWKYYLQYLLFVFPVYLVDIELLRQIHDKKAI